MLLVKRNCFPAMSSANHVLVPLFSLTLATDPGRDRGIHQFLRQNNSVLFWKVHSPAYWMKLKSQTEQNYKHLMGTLQKWKQGVWLRKLTRTLLTCAWQRDHWEIAKLELMQLPSLCQWVECMEPDREEWALVVLNFKVMTSLDQRTVCQGCTFVCLWHAMRV